VRSGRSINAFEGIRWIERSIRLAQFIAINQPCFLECSSGVSTKQLSPLIFADYRNKRFRHNDRVVSEECGDYEAGNKRIVVQTLHGLPRFSTGISRFHCNIKRDFSRRMRTTRESFPASRATRESPRRRLVATLHRFRFIVLYRAHDWDSPFFMHIFAKRDTRTYTRTRAVHE
jgi:hypothetical protein